MKKIVIVAGDKSGDIYGGLLSKKLKENFCGDVDIFSFGGDNLAQNSHQVINLLSHSVSGIIEVFFLLKEFFRVFREALSEIEKIKPDLIILIDFPDFNLRLAESLNKKYPLFYYISPQIWAWRKNRIKIIKKYVDKMIVIFKFEEDFYKNEGVDALYFGHPLLEIIKKGNIPVKKRISFLPGSRKNEIKRHLPVLIETKKILEQHLKGYTFCVIRPKNIEKNFYEGFYPGIDVIDYSPEAIEESEFIVSSSGTATVEIAILEVPYLIIYKVNPLTWQLLKIMVKTKFIGMVNILSSKKVIEELLQNQVTPQNIAGKTLEIMSDPAKYNQIKGELKNIRQLLSPYGATEKFAEFIVQYLNKY